MDLVYLPYCINSHYSKFVLNNVVSISLESKFKQSGYIKFLTKLNKSAAESF